MENESIKTFIARTQLTVQVQSCGINPYAVDFGPGTRHYSITIGREGFGPCKPLHTFFSQGSGLKKAPTLADVIDCLASDASSVENARDFEEWADEMGYDTDSRKAEKTYNVIREQAKHLRALLGATEYKNLLFNTERL